MQIALLGSENEPQVIHVAGALKSEGHEPIIVNTQYFGKHWQLTYDPDFHDGLLHFLDSYPLDNNRMTLSEVHAVYWHQYLPPAMPHEDPKQAQWIDQEVTSALLCWFNFSDIKWVNGISAIRAHQCKPSQMQVAAHLGAHLPYTFVGNSEIAAFQFCNNMGEVIYKPIRGGETTHFLHKGTQLRHQLSQLLLSRPVMLQAYVPGINIRSYVFGDEVLSVQIESHDTQTAESQHHKPLIVITPADIQRLCVAICKGLDMHWCTINWRKTAKGDYFFLDADPCPDFITIENQTGMDMTGRLIKVLTQ